MTETTYEPVYTLSQQSRLARLCPSARCSFLHVLAALQTAEVIGAPEGMDYLRLMEAVIEEAAERRDYCRDHTMG